jgi:hypothetical protein
MESHVMDGAFISQLTSAAVVVYLLQFLKKTVWYQRFATRLPIADAHVHRVVSLLGAFISAIGVHIAFTGNAASGWQFAGTIPPLAVVLHSGWDLLQQFALNQLTYDAVAQKAGTAKGVDFLTTTRPSAGAPAGPGMRFPVILLVAALGAGVLVSSCASFRTLPLVDQVRLELDAAEWGVKADHDFGTNWLSDADVAVFQHIDDTIRQVLATNPTNAKAASRAAAIVERDKLPADSKLRPYVNALVDALG